MPNSIRQLAAIMFTDIVGYTAIMGKDSAKAMELVRHSKEIQKPLVEKHHGKWLKEMGDGAMAQFGSALDAVNCALEIQRLSRADFGADLRIGIHLGDITVENNDVYGDGVNVAARLESIADPGGIYVSESIEKAIRGQSKVMAKYIGEIKLKNVDYDVRTYALQGIGLPVPDLKNDKELSGRFFAEMKRRGVIRVGIIYILLSLLLTLLVPYASNWIALPDSFSSILVTILIIGFPAAVYLAWRYERSPEGFVRSNSKQSWQNPWNTSQKKPFTSNFIIAGLILVIVAMYVYPNYPTNPSKNVGINNLNKIENKSVAVLPFSDMSPNKDQEYLGDGIAEEILNVLAKIKGIKVIGRTSSFSYKGKNTDLRTIGEELGVATILEGSVRKDGNQIRITAQFINAKDQSHIWSVSYDRELNSIFEIQDDIAESISKTMLSSFNIDRHGYGRKIENEEAYNLYLLGKYHLSMVGDLDEDTKENIYKAIELFEQSLALDGGIADTYTGLASAYTKIGFRYGEFEQKDVWNIADSYADKALELDEANSEALRHKAYIKRNRDWDWEEAKEYYKKSLVVAPGNSIALSEFAILLSAINQHDSARLCANKALELNPTSRGAKVTVMRSEYYARRYKEAIKRSESLDQLSAASRRFILRILIQTDRDKAAEMILNLEGIDEATRKELDVLYRKEGWESFMMALYDSYSDIIAQGQKNYEILIFGAPKDIVFEHLAADVQNRVGFSVYLLVDPLFDPLRSDPRFDGLLETMGLDKYK
jgi:TolB-like protein/class 3 adenylate cyclase/Tfp pilus assembly protein PilF